MYSNPGARKSIDSLSSPTSPHTHRQDFPFHSGNRHGSVSSRRPSTAGSIHSVGGALDQGIWSDTVLESGQNGVCIALRDSATKLIFG